MNNFVSLQVPELAGSWLLTLLLSTPLILLLNINDNAILLPLERALHLIMGLFVLFEVIIGYFAIRAMVNYQVSSIGPSSKFLLNLMIALIIKIFVLYIGIYDFQLFHDGSCNFYGGKKGLTPVDPDSSIASIQSYGKRNYTSL